MLPPTAEARELPRLRNRVLSPLAEASSLGGVWVLMIEGMAA